MYSIFCVISSRHLFHNISYVSFKIRSWQDKPAQPSWHLQVPSWQSPRLLQFNGQAYQNHQRIRKIEAAVLVFCLVCMVRFLAAFHSVPVIYLSSKVGNLNAKRRKNGDDLCLRFLLLQRALLLSKLLTFCSESFTNRISWWQKRILKSRFMTWICIPAFWNHCLVRLSFLLSSLTACLTSYTCIYLEAIWVSVWSWYLVAEKLQGNSAFAAAGSNPGIQLNHVFKACIGSAMFGNSIWQGISDGDANWSTICPPRRSLQSTCNALAALAFSNWKCQHLKALKDGPAMPNL